MLICSESVIQGKLNPREGGPESDFNKCNSIPLHNLQKLQVP